jgi:hypothetical protein
MSGPTPPPLPGITTCQYLACISALSRRTVELSASTFPVSLRVRVVRALHGNDGRTRGGAHRKAQGESSVLTLIYSESLPLIAEDVEGASMEFILEFKGVYTYLNNSFSVVP